MQYKSGEKRRADDESSQRNQSPQFKMVHAALFQHGRRWRVRFAPQQHAPTSRPAPQSAVSLCQRYRDLWPTLLLLSAVAATVRAGERRCLIWLSFVISKVARSGRRQTRWQGRGGGIDARDRGGGGAAGEEIDAAC